MTNYPEAVSVGNEARNVGGGDRSGDGRDRGGSQASLAVGTEQAAGRASREVSRFDDRPREGKELRASAITESDAGSEVVQRMTIDEYGNWTESFWFSGHNRPEKESIAIMGLGLAGEAGEVVEHLKKFIRDDHINVTELKKELGDSIYYWCRICKQFGLEPTEVLEANMEKLISRMNRGVLRGDGDNR
jgi:NTP pyrophosphatase (non-canonical NTP hydrolase)